MQRMNLASAVVTLVMLTAGTTQCSRAPDLVDEPAPPRPVANQAPSPTAPVLGSARALVTVVTFTDYECPYCAKADKTVATLFADRAGLDDAGLVASARAVGLDMRAFESARTGSSTAAALERVEALATSLGVNGTPTFFVNGRRMVGARPYDTFRALIDEERARAEEMVAGGVAREKVYDTLRRAAPPAPAQVRAPENDEPAVDMAIDGAPARGASRAPSTRESLRRPRWPPMRRDASGSTTTFSSRIETPSTAHRSRATRARSVSTSRGSVAISTTRAWRLASMPTRRRRPSSTWRVRPRRS